MDASELARSNEEGEGSQDPYSDERETRKVKWRRRENAPPSCAIG